MMPNLTTPPKPEVWQDLVPKLPQWKCHKVVRAARIFNIEKPRREQTAFGLVLDVGLIACVDQAWMDKHAPQVGGYYVVYEDGYQSYSPQGPFEAGYRRIAVPAVAEEPPHGRSFGWALERLKEGKRVARMGWNGKGMYLWLLPAATVKAEWCKEPHLRELAEAQGGAIEALGSIRMLTADRKVLTGWLASQTDMLAEDWWEVMQG